MPPVKQTAGIILGLTGWIFAIVACFLPRWKTTAFIGANTVIPQIIWEGLWMNCVTHSTGQIKCKVYNAKLLIPLYLQAARTLSILSIITALLALTVSITGTMCTNDIKCKELKAKVMLISGVLFFIAGVLILIPASWISHIIIQQSYTFPVFSREEIGGSIYTGFTAAALLISGSLVVLCFSRTTERM